MPEPKFCCPDNYSVIIPYSDLVKIVEMASKYEIIEARYARLEEQYTAIRGMFSECMDAIRDIRNFVQD